MVHVLGFNSKVVCIRYGRTLSIDVEFLWLKKEKSRNLRVLRKKMDTIYSSEINRNKHVIEYLQRFL